MYLIRVLDTETTGVDPKAEVCEVGFCDLAHDVGGWEILSTGSALSKVSIPMPPEAQAVHHISDADLARYGVDGFPEAWAYMLDGRWTSDGNPALPHASVNAYAAHNAAFEQRFIGREWTGKTPWICTYKCALRAWPDAPAFGNMVLRYWLNIALGDPELAMPAHSALADSYITAHILRELIKKHPVETLVTWTAEPRAFPRCPLGKHRGEEWGNIPHGYLEWLIKTPAEPGQDNWPDIQACARRELSFRKTGQRAFV